MPLSPALSARTGRGSRRSYLCSSVFICGSLLLYQFQVIPKRISEMKPVISRDLRLIRNLPTPRLNRRAPGRDVLDFECDMGSGLVPLDAVFRAKMHFERPGIQPHPAA